MKWLTALLTFANISVVTGVLLGMAEGGLSRSLATLSLLVGLAAAILAWWFTDQDPSRSPPPEQPGESSETSLSRRALKRRKKEPVAITPPSQRYRHIWLWLMVGVFAIFAGRSFCWLLFLDGNEWRVQSPNNLGDLSLHITYIKQFASGVSLWPDNPIHAFSKLRYPAGIDLFNGLLTCLGVDVPRGLVWTGLLASAATCYALYRWAGSFGIAAFLFNGGVASYVFLNTRVFQDYQGVNTIAWKSIPLSMFVTQRGLLYAIPAAILLLFQWRARFFPDQQEALAAGSLPASDRPENGMKKPPLPFWVELSLYATMPLFHVHTFMSLSIVLVFIFFFGNANTCKQLLLFVGAAFLPAVFFVWVISDNFHAGSVLEWKPGWVQQNGEFAMPFLKFWLVNFGAWVPLVLFFVGITALTAWKIFRAPDFKIPAGAAFLVPAGAIVFLAGLLKLALGQWQKTNSKTWLYLVIVLSALVIPIALWDAWKRFSKAPDSALPAVFPFITAAIAIFLLTYLVKTAPWEWDNIKIMVWAYFIVLPFLWKGLISQWPFPLRAIACMLLFFSGFVSLFGGLKAGQPGFGVAERTELDAVGKELKQLPVDARFAGYATYNHPVLLQGRKMVLGYAGHLWTQGFNTSVENDKLQALLNGAPNWKDNARYLHTRYLFWGRMEKANYPASTRPWERESRQVAAGDWGAIYDLEAPPALQPAPQKAPGQ
jgi:hypothetical protein